MLLFLVAALLWAAPPPGAAIQPDRTGGIVLVDPMEAMARLMRARALAQAGNVLKAKEAYEDLLVLWKDADADVPLVDEARKEHASLA